MTRMKVGILIASLCLVLSCVSASSGSHAERDSRMIVSLPSEWKLPLHPALQHSAYEDLILSHEFEALVYRDANGGIHPLAAVSYEVNADFTTYRFKINSKRRFSDGRFLSASDYKRSWEKGLSLQANSANKNQLDGLMLARGFNDFEKTGTISGIEVVDNETLVLHYDKPFRLALSHLAGSRYGAFAEKNGTLVGTGKYVIEQLSNEKLILRKNPFNQDQSGIDVIEVVYQENQIEELKNGRSDVAAFNTKKFSPMDGIATTESYTVGSSWLLLNGLQGRTFASPELRKGFQALVWRILRNKPASVSGLQQLVQLDPQIYPQGQASRIPDNEVEDIIRSGEPFIAKLISESQKKPIKIYLGDSISSLFSDFEREGLKFEKMEQRSFLNVLKDWNHDFSADVVGFGAGFNISDPDGVYHLLGKNGAITSPIINRERVMALLEEGRNITDKDQIPSHYRKVTRAVLEDIPGVHLGHLQTNFVYRDERVKFNERFMGQGIRRFYIFEPVN